ncbi:MAG: 50S ribosomal protein L1 [Actinobacteria bacterium]|nr:50S ribosomal protein L1 [Actinomycetota bacterium]
MKRGKKYTEKAKDLDRSRLYSPKEAIEWILANHFVKFEEAVDISMNLGVDPRKADQIVRGALVLPNGTGKVLKILVFAQGEKAKEAQEAGADYVGGEELVEKISGGWLDFEVCIATPDMMKHVGKVAKILGPRKLMPNPKSGTVTFELLKTINEARAGRLEYRTDKNGVIHGTIGRVSFDIKDLLENYAAFVDAITKARPSSAKGRYIRGIYLSSTMGPGIKIDPSREASMEEVA